MSKPEPNPAAELAAHRFHGQAQSPTHTYDPDLPDWIDKGLCSTSGVDPEVFFPSKGSQALEAKRICGVCGVREQCREYAVKMPGLSGIWGGLNERERRVMRERLGLAG